MSNELTAVVPVERQQEATALVTWARGLAITTVAERDEAVERGKAAKALAKAITESFEPSRKAAQLALEAIRDQRDGFVTPLQEVERLVKGKCGAFDEAARQAAEKERIRLQAIEDERSRKEQAALMARAEKLKTPERAEALREQAASIVAPAVLINAPQKAAGTSTAKMWDYEITDPRAVPDEYKMIDTSKLGKVVRAVKGTITIPGVRMFEKTQQRW